MTIGSFRRAAAGQQYAIIVGLIGAVAIVAVSVTGQGISRLFSGVGNQVGGISNAGASGTSPPPPPPPPAGPSTVYAWGRNAAGQLGDGTNTSRSTPVTAVNMPNGITALAASQAASCALTGAGAIWCWGDDANGILGDGAASGGTSNPTPVAVSNGGAYNGTNAVEISLGAHHACARLNTGGLVCWGLNTEGRLGDNGTTTRTAPVNVYVPGVSPYNGSNAAKISAGNNNSCFINSSGEANCWGRGVSGTNGNGNTNDLYFVSNSSLGTGAAYNGSNAAQISVAGTSCLLTTGKTAVCWGANPGNGTSTSTTPVNVTSAAGYNGSNMEMVAAGNIHSCGLLSTGAVICWGGGSGQGELANSGFTSSNSPVAALSANGYTGTNAVAITLGQNLTCARLSGGGMVCSGRGTDGQLGNAGTTSINGFVAVGGGPFGSVSRGSGGTTHLLAMP